MSADRCSHCNARAAWHTTLYQCAACDGAFCEECLAGIDDDSALCKACDNKAREGHELSMYEERQDDRGMA